MTDILRWLRARWSRCTGRSRWQEVAGLAAALDLVEPLAARLDRYHLLHVVRADLLRRLGREAEALLAYHTAIERADNEAEQEHLRRVRGAGGVTYTETVI